MIQCQVVSTVGSLPLIEGVEVVCFVVMADDAHAVMPFLITKELTEPDAWVNLDVRLSTWYCLGVFREANFLWRCLYRWLLQSRNARGRIC